MEKKPLPEEFKEFVQCLNAHKVKYLLIGGWAVAFHGHPRATKDIDFLLLISPENIKRTKKALEDFGSPPIDWELFKEEGYVIRIGSAPTLIDIINKASGIEFKECYKRRVVADIDGITIHTISKDDLIKNKNASNRDGDLKDVYRLTNRNIIDNETSSILKCKKYKLIDTSGYNTLETMKLLLVSDYNNNVFKYTKRSNNETKYYLARNINNSDVELFYMNKNFNKKQAQQFLVNWDKKYNNKVQTIPLPKKRKAK